MPEQAIVTKAYTITEAAQPPVTVTKLYALTQIGEDTVISPRITKLYSLTEISERAAKVTKMYALMQLALYGPYPVKVKDNVSVSFDGNSLNDYIQSFSLECAMNEANTTVFTTDGEAKIGIHGDWSIKITGIWSDGLDDILGAAVSDTPETKVTCVAQLGAGLFAVTYTWTSQAFLQSYRVTPNIDDVIHFDAVIALSGNPSRSSQL